MTSAMYAHTCEACGDTGIIIFDEGSTHIDPCKCQQGTSSDLNGGHTRCVLTIFFVFILFLRVSYTDKKYSDFLKIKNFSDFSGIIKQ